MSKQKTAIVGDIQKIVVRVFKSSAFKRALWNFVNAVIALFIADFVNAGYIESGVVFAILNGATKELNKKLSK